MASQMVFLSYAREDALHAERLYADLREASIDVWLDTKRLLPGHHWKREIRKAIKESAIFIALVSAHSRNKRGFVNTEMKKAFEVLSEVPSDQVYLIQARLDNSQHADDELHELNWIDLFPDYHRGFERLLSALSHLRTTPLEFLQSRSNPVRAPIYYSPFRSFRQFADDIFGRMPRNAAIADPDRAVYVRFKTNVEGVELPDELLEKFPSEIVIVIQNQFEELSHHGDHATLIVRFNGAAAKVKIPYDAIIDISVPAIGLRVENVANVVVQPSGGRKARPRKSSKKASAKRDAE